MGGGGKEIDKEKERMREWKSDKGRKEEIGRYKR